MKSDPVRQRQSLPRRSAGICSEATRNVADWRINKSRNKETGQHGRRGWSRPKKTKIHVEPKDELRQPNDSVRPEVERNLRITPRKSVPKPGALFLLCLLFCASLTTGTGVPARSEEPASEATASSTPFSRSLARRRGTGNHSRAREGRPEEPGATPGRRSIPTSCDD